MPFLIWPASCPADRPYSIESTAWLRSTIVKDAKGWGWKVEFYTHESRAYLQHIEAEKVYSKDLQARRPRLAEIWSDEKERRRDLREVWRREAEERKEKKKTDRMRYRMWDVVLGKYGKRAKGESVEGESEVGIEEVGEEELAEMQAWLNRYKKRKERKDDGGGLEL